MVARITGDLDTYMGYYRQDVLLEDPRYPDPRRGPAAVREDLDGLLTAYPDGRRGQILEENRYDDPATVIG